MSDGRKLPDMPPIYAMDKIEATGRAEIWRLAKFLFSVTYGIPALEWVVADRVGWYKKALEIHTFDFEDNACTRQHHEWPEWLGPEDKMRRKTIERFTTRIQEILDNLNNPPPSSNR